MVVFTSQPITLRGMSLTSHCITLNLYMYLINLRPHWHHLQHFYTLNIYIYCGIRLKYISNICEMSVFLIKLSNYAIIMTN